MRKHHLARGIVCLLLAAGLICSAAPVASAAQADAPSLQTDAAQAAALVDLEQAKADLTQAREAAGLIEDAVKLNADVMNLSLGSTAGFYGDMEFLQAALEKATADGVLCCVAVGTLRLGAAAEPLCG